MTDGVDQASLPDPVVPPYRSHGFEKPLNRSQVIAMIVTFLMPIISIVLLLLETLPLLLLLLLLLLHLAASSLTIGYGYLTTATDTTDTHLRRKYHPSPPDEEEASPRPFYCSTCQVRVSKRTKHCNVCNRCVEVFDHHCVFLNTCIGRVNYHLFLRLIAVCLTESLLTTITALSPWVLKQVKTGAVVPLAVAGFVCGLLGIALVGQLFLFHRKLRKEGITTYEFVKRERSRPKSHREKFALSKFPCLPSGVAQMVTRPCYHPPTKPALTVVDLAKAKDAAGDTELPDIAFGLPVMAVGGLAGTPRGQMLWSASLRVSGLDDPDISAIVEEEMPPIEI